MSKEIPITDVDLLEICENGFLIGKVWKEEGSSITPMAPHNYPIAIYIKAVTDDPVASSEINEKYHIFQKFQDYYIALDANQSPDILPEFYNAKSYDYEDNLSQLNEALENKYVIFRPEYQKNKKSSETQQYKDYFKNAYIHKILDDDIDDIHSDYVLIPRIKMDVKEFEEKLMHLQYVKFEDYYEEIYKSPYCVLCDNYLYFADGWTRTDQVMWKINDPESLKRVKIDTREASKNSHLISVDNSNVFIDTLYFDKADQIFEPVVLKEPLSDASGVKNEEELEIAKSSEEKFLDSFFAVTQKSCLCYDKKDLVNFHVCVKSSLLTILAGMPGTGKTQLALSYAEAMDMNPNNETLLFLPISPSYTEPADILGYLNHSNSLYMPSETKLVDLLIHAERNPDQMHMVIFDEMNLAQIEHWFSPFISILEVEENVRKLQLYNRNTRCFNDSYYPSELKIGKNIIFIGTINLDETTKEISDRLLDRAYVLNLKKRKFKDYREEQEKIKRLDESIISSGKCGKTITFEEWKTKENYVSVFKNEELEFLDELHELISQYNAQKGVSFRVLKNIGRYLGNIPRMQSDIISFDRKEAFDYLIAQTILKKLRGSDSFLMALCGQYSGIDHDLESSELIKLFERYSDLSQFDICKSLISRKAQDLALYGYTR